MPAQGRSTTSLPPPPSPPSPPLPPLPPLPPSPPPPSPPRKHSQPRNHTGDRVQHAVQTHAHNTGHNLSNNITNGVAPQSNHHTVCVGVYVYILPHSSVHSPGEDALVAPTNLSITKQATQQISEHLTTELLRILMLLVNT